VVGEVGSRRSSLGIEGFAEIQIQVVVGELLVRPFVAGPPVVPERRERAQPVDLLPAVPADVADPDLGGARARREPERVAQAHRHDATRVRVAAREERIAGNAGARRRIDANDRSVEGDRIARASQVLTPERPSLGERRRLDAADRNRRVTSGVQWIAVLPIVGPDPARSVPPGRVQISVHSEEHAPDRVARVLLEPVVQKHEL
jgi:hypothetical protein